MKNKILIYTILVFALLFIAYAEIDLTIIFPPDNFYTNNQTPSFSFSIYSNTSINNCTLYIDGTPYGTNESIVNGTNVIIANDTILEGAHTWYVNCSDEYGTNTTPTRTINIDVTQPGIQTIGTNLIDGIIRYEDLGGLYVVEVYFDSVMNESVFPNLTFSPNLDALLTLNNSNWYNSSRVDYTYNINYVNLTVTDINLTVTNAYDLAGNTNNDNNTWTVILEVDTQEPLLSLDSISNNRRYNVSQLDLNYTVSGQEYCWYELDGELTNLTSCENTILSNLTEGVHSFLLYANDTVNNVVYRSIIFYIDTLTPTYNYSISHSQISHANNSQMFSVLINWSEQMNQSIGPTLYFTPDISIILNSCGYYWLDSNASSYNCTIYYILSYEQFDVNLTIFNASDLAGNFVAVTSYGNITNIDMDGPHKTTDTIDAFYTNLSYILGEVFNFTVGFNYSGVSINSSSCGYSLNGLNGSWQYNQTAFNGTHCVFQNINSSEINNSIHTLSVFVSDLWGNNVTWSFSEPVFRDVSAPTTTPSGNGYTFGDWTANPVNVTFSCDDGVNSSMCQATYTCWDSTNNCTPVNLTTESSSIYISSQGTFYVRYYSVDNLNNTEAIGSVTVNIDTTTPAVSINISNNTLIGNNSLPYIIRGTASGGASGIKSLTLYVYATGYNMSYNMSYNISNVYGNNWNFTWIPSEGVYNLTTEVCDLTDFCINSSTVSNITVDLTSPNTTNNANTTDWNTIFIVTLTPDESVSYTTYKIGNNAWQNGTEIVINGSSNISSGNVLVRYYSVDRAGNPENEKNFTVKYDITPPTSMIIGFLDDYSPYTFDVWGTDTALVNLSGTDAHSGINRTLYCTDMTNTCTPSIVWNETLNITTSGITYIRYRSIDNLSNTEIIRISRVMILQNNTVYINASLNLTENETNIIVLENNTDSIIYVPPNVNATLDFSQLINISTNTTHNVTLNGSINVTVNTTIIIYLELPGNLTLSGNNSWLGNFNLPKIMPLSSVTVTPTLGFVATNDMVIEIGADDVPILLDKAIRVRLEGKSDKLLGYYRDGFTKIIAVCENDTQEWADTYLNSSASGHCRMNAVNSTDLIIWTKHLSKFVTYTEAEDNNNGGGGGSGGGGGGSSGLAYVPSSTNTTMTNPSVSYSYVFLENGTRIINITHSQIPLYAMALMTNETTHNVRFKITAVSNPPIEKAETVYKYIQIDHENINDSIIIYARLQFKVDKEWLSENKIEKNQIVLYRYSGGWTMLNTSIIKEDSAGIYYESLSPGLSLFAIATKPRPPVTVVEPPQDIQSAELTPEDITIEEDRITEGKSNPTVVVIIVLAIIVLLLYSFYVVKNKK